MRVSWAQVAEIDVDAEKLISVCTAAELEPASLRSDELALVDSVLDNQVLDMRRRVFVRVQDVLLQPTTAISWWPGWTRAAARSRGASASASSRAACRGGAATSCPWADVNLISLRLSRLNFVEAFAELAELHPADIADMVSQVGPRERAAVLAALDPGLAADTLQEMEEELAAAALQEMPLERAVTGAREARDRRGRRPARHAPG